MENKSQDLQQLMTDVRELKNSMVGHSISHITDSMDEIKLKVSDLKTDVTEIKREILNPETGIIVRINKLQDKLHFIEKEKITKIETTLEELENLNMNYRQISGFKENVVKFLWLFLGGILTVLIQLLQFLISKQH